MSKYRGPFLIAVFDRDRDRTRRYRRRTVMMTMKAARIGNFIYIFFFRVFSSSIKLNCPSSLKIVLFELRLEFIVLPLCWISNLDCEIIVHVHSENGDKRGIRVFSFLFLIQRVVYFFFFLQK